MKGIEKVGFWVFLHNNYEELCENGYMKIIFINIHFVFLHNNYEEIQNGYAYKIIFIFILL